MAKTRVRKTGLRQPAEPLKVCDITKNTVREVIAGGELSALAVKKKLAEEAGCGKTLVGENLTAAGISISQVRREVVEELAPPTNQRIEDFLNQRVNPTTEMEAKWQTEGNKDNADQYRIAFTMHMQGSSDADVCERLDLLPSIYRSTYKPVILADLEEHIKGTGREVLERFIKPPVVTPQEASVFEMVALKGLTRVQAGRKLPRPIKQPRTSTVLLSLFNKLPACERLLPPETLKGVGITGSSVRALIEGGVYDTGAVNRALSRAAGCSVSTVRSRLKSRGINISGMRSEVVAEVAHSTNQEIEAYLAGRLQPTGEMKERWRARGSRHRIEQYRQAFQMRLQGESEVSICDVLGVSPSTYRSRIKRVIEPDVSDTLRRASYRVRTHFLKPPVVTPQEAQVFELVAVHELALEDAGASLTRPVTEGRVSQVLSNLTGRLPACDRLLEGRRETKHFSQEKRRRRAERARRRARLSGRIDSYLQSPDVAGLESTIKAIALRSGTPVKTARELAESIPELSRQVNRKRFPQGYGTIATEKLIASSTLRADMDVSLSRLKDVARESRKLIADVGCGARSNVFETLATVRNIQHPERVRGRVGEIKMIAGMLADELQAMDAPRECWGKVIGKLMLRSVPVEQGEKKIFYSDLIDDVRARVGTYESLRDDITDAGHPLIVAQYIGVGAMDLRSPLTRWRSELGKAIGREHDQFVESKGYVSKTGLSDSEFTSLLDNSKGGDEDSEDSIIQAYQFLFPHEHRRDDPPESIAHARGRAGAQKSLLDSVPLNIQDGTELSVTESSLEVLRHIIQVTPLTEIPGGWDALTRFTSYTSYALKVNEIQLSRQRWALYHQRSLQPQHEPYTQKTTGRGTFWF